MIFPSVDNFLRIFNFYQLNSIRYCKQLSQKVSLRFNTIDKYFESLNYDYPDGQPGLIFPKHKDEILQAINSRLDISKYFNGAGFPGSYSFNTIDCYMFKSIILDWAGTIKTFQDTTAQCTNAYSLSSDEVDKAIRGFGIDFINSRTVASLNRRQTFLLNMCDLYKIKGSPDSIVKALNIIGLEDCYITEAWVYPTRDGRENVEIKWIPIKRPNELVETSTSGQYIDQNEGIDEEYWEWGKFNSKLDEIKECHWFYKKWEIVKLNWNQGLTKKDKNYTYMHLPSLTPYFNVKIKFSNNDHTTTLRMINRLAKQQIVDFLSGVKPKKDVIVGNSNLNTSFLAVWQGFLYMLVMYADYLRFNDLRHYTTRFGFTGLDTSDIVGPNKFLELAYRIYTFINKIEDPSKKQIYQKTLEHYVLTAVPVGYCSYDELEYWWLTKKHEKVDSENGLDGIRSIIKISNYQLHANGKYIEIFWNEPHNYGYYDIQVCLDEGNVYTNWTTIEENCKVSSQSMQRIIDAKYDEAKIPVEDARERIRIVHYHTPENIPTIFYQKPFYLGSFTNSTDLDMIYYYSDFLMHDLHFQNNPIFNIFKSSTYGVQSSIPESELIENYNSYLKNLPFRNTDRDFRYATFMNSFLKYPTSLFREDKDIIKETALRKYITDITFNYKDFITHDGEKLNYVNIGNRYPQNKKWNWAISYGKNKNTTYFFLNYEGTKWLRIKSRGLVADNNINLDTEIFTENDYGIPVYKNGNLYIHVSKNDGQNKIGSYFNLNSDSVTFEDNWNALGYEKIELDYNSEKLDTLKNEYNVDVKRENGKMSFVSSPSDLFPSTVIKIHTFTVKQKDEKGLPYYVEKKFYYSDSMFKPDSKLAKCVVVDKVDPSYLDAIFQNISEVQNDTNIDSDPDNNMDNIRIPVYNDPFGSNIQYSYQISDLFKYMYKNGYILDINSGFIYKNFNYYLDEQTNYIYIKCINLDEDEAQEKIKYRWIRTKCSRIWDINEDRKSIYYQLDADGNYVTDYLGKRNPIFDCGYCDQDFTYRRVYDSERYLADPYVNGLDYSSVTDNDVHILHVGSGRYYCEVQRDYINEKNEDVGKKYIPESTIKTYHYDKETDSVHEVYTQFKEPLIMNVNYGLDQDLLDYINAKLTSYEDSMEQYTNLILELAEALQEYLKNNGYKCVLDVYNTHIFSSRLVRNIINFYKPKRDRMLRLVSQLEIDFNDYTLNDIDDINYNRIRPNNVDGKENLNISDENGLRNRSRIKQQINEYVPFNDLIYLKDYKNDNEVVNYREVYPYVNSLTPQIEVYDKLDNIGDYYIMYDDKKIYASYYCSGFDQNVDGFYFDISKTGNKYTNNRYYFYKTTYTFLSNYDVDGTPFDKRHYITLTRWFVYEYAFRNDKCYHFNYVSEDDISDNPYLKPNGEPLKYCKLENIEDYDTFILYLNKAEYKYGIFQHYTKDNSGYIKTNKRNITPTFYIGDFENPKYNGYYYALEDKKRFGYPIYFNKNGKMISFYDLSFLPDTYLDLTIKEYHRNDVNMFWIITDYCQIPDISEATYIAFCESAGDTSIFKTKNGISTGETKTFYKLNPKLKSDVSDLLFVCGVCGYSLDIIAEYPHLLGEDYQTYKGKKDSNGNYTIPLDKYSKLFNRRISQNTLPEMYTPISYINFYYGNGLYDFYNTTTIEVTDIDRAAINLNKRYYGHDFNGYQYGALYCNEFTNIKFTNDISNKDLHIILRIRNVLEDSTKLYGKPVDELNKYIRQQNSKWHLYHLKYDSKQNMTYLYKDGFYEAINNVDVHNIVIQNQCCYICEFAVFDQNLPDWYLPILNDYGVFAYRKEQKKKYNAVKDSYEPLFNTDMPRSCYGKMVTGLPENIQGDRFSSTFYNTSNGKYIESHYDGADRYNTFKWDAAGYYKVYVDTPHGRILPNSPQEINILWSKKTCNRIYDKVVVPELDIHGNVIGTTVKRVYTDNRLKQNNFENIYCEKLKTYFCHGQELKAPGNYISPFDNEVPVWWTKKPEDYKTGPVQHRPVIIGIREKKDEFYPVVKAGGKLGRFFDEGLKYDGDIHSDCHGTAIYNTSEIDSNTGYASTVNRFLSETNGKEFTRRKIVENNGDSFYYPCEHIESNIFYDPSIQEVTQEMKDSHIYHKCIYLNPCSDFIYDISGQYYATKLNSLYKKEYDFEYCYHQTKNVNEANRGKLIWKLQNNRTTWINSDDIVPLFDDIIAVLTYDKKCRHYIWEVRKYKNYLSTEPEDNCTFCIKQNLKTSDGSSYYYSICHETIICTNYVKCKFILNNPDERFIDDVKGYYTEDYDSIVHTAIQYGSLVDINIPENVSLEDLKSYYERFTKSTIHNMNELFMAAYITSSKYKLLKHNNRINKMYYAHNNYDYVNQLQLDLCGQKLCQYDPQLREKYSHTPYVDVKQNVIENTVGFLCYSILRFRRDNSEELHKIRITDKYIDDEFCLIEDKLYVRFEKYWYGPYSYNKKEKFKNDVKNKLRNICCKINSVYTGDKLYVKTQDKWVSVNFATGTYDKLCIPFEKYMDTDGNMLICMCHTNPEFNDWNYYPKVQEIQTTVSRYMTLNNRGTEQFDHFGKPWPEDKKDDVYFGKSNLQTILDKLFTYVYYVCQINAQFITLHAPESGDLTENILTNGIDNF